MLKNLIEAFRLPFVGASVLPFIFGSVISRENFSFPGFILGLFAVIATHISANLINDYADSRSGADWQDKNSHLASCFENLSEPSHLIAKIGEFL